MTLSQLSRGSICALAALTLSSTTAGADAFDRYGGVFRQVSPPPVGDGSFGVAVDALPDGRLLTLTGTDVLVETSLGANDFAVAATFDESILPAPVDPGFILLSPSGMRIAVGAGFGLPVIVFDADLLDAASPPALTASDTTVFDVPHFNAAWLDDDHLALTAGVFGQPSFVSLLNVASDSASPDNPVIISNIDGASSGVGFDQNNTLFTGNGFANSPGVPGASQTGWIKAFTQSQWESGADFEQEGLFIADILSAASLVFDDEGNLFVGGGDFDAGDTGTLAIVSAQAIAHTLSTGDPVDDNDPAQVRRLDPLMDGSGFFSAAYNASTSELLITGGALWHATSGRRPGDLDNNGVVNGADIALLLASFGSSNIIADLNADGVVDGADLAILLSNWGDR